MIILGQGIIGMPVTAKDHHLMVGSGVVVILEEIMSQIIVNPGRRSSSQWDWNSPGMTSFQESHYGLGSLHR